MSDDVLLAGFGVGEYTLSVAFVRRFQSVVFGSALSVLGDRNAAQDVAQRSFEDAWRHATTYDPGRGSVRAWLATIARHEAIATARHRGATPTDPAVLADLLGGCVADPGPESIAVQAASGPLRSALATLPHEQARALVLSVVHGYTAQEIAHREKIPVGTAKTRIRTAVRKLRDSLLAGAERDDLGRLSMPSGTGRNGRT